MCAKTHSSGQDGGVAEISRWFMQRKVAVKVIQRQISLASRPVRFSPAQGLEPLRRNKPALPQNGVSVTTPSLLSNPRLLAAFPPSYLNFFFLSHLKNSPPPRHEACDSLTIPPGVGMAVGSTLTFWKQCEGQVVDGQFVLRQYLGGSDHSAVFLTERGKPQPKKAAIKLVSASNAAESQLARWQSVARLSNPHLLQLFETGRCQLENENYFYVAMQYAEEDLSQILPGRALSATEVQDMLPPLLSALRYVHSQGLVHGQVKPANIMAVNDQLKLSSDSISPAGKSAIDSSRTGVYDAPECTESGRTAASDMWSFGMTLVEVLTQRPAMREGAQGELLLPQTMPMPFREIAAQCLRRDPRERWTIEQIERRLHPDKEPRGAPKPAAAVRESVDPEEVPKRRLRPIFVIVVALVVIFIGLKFFRRSSESTPATSNPSATAQNPRASDSETRTAPGHRKPAAQTPGGAQPRDLSSVPPSGGGGGNTAIVEQVMPDISRSARDTIEGTIKINVRVSVDSSGSVSDARFERRGPSEYFARKSMEAAGKWKFTPKAAGAWLLHFEFRRSGVRVIPQPLGS